MRRRAVPALVVCLAACAALASAAGGAATPPAIMLVLPESNALGQTAQTFVGLLPTQGATLPAASVTVYVPTG